MTAVLTLTPEQQKECRAIEAEIAELKRKIAETQEQTETARRVMPICFFEPNPWQYKAIEDMAKHVLPKVQNTVGHFPGNSAGKTFLIPAMMWVIATHNSNGIKWFNYPLYQAWPFPKHLRVIGRKQLFFEGTGEFWKAIWKWWPQIEGEPYGWSCEKGDYHYPCRYKLPNGFTLDCVTPEQSEHEGVELGMLALLEPEEENIWNQYVRAFRHGGIKLLSCTMARMSEWMDRRVLQDPKAIITEGHPMDNCDETVVKTPKGLVRGKLPRESLESMRDNYAEEELATRWDGKPIYWRGRVLAGLFDEEIHVEDDDKLPAIQLYKINVDPHPRKPWCMIVAGIDADGDTWILDEWPRFETFGKFYHEISSDKPEHGEAFYFAMLDELLHRKYPRNRRIVDYKMSRTPDRTTGGTSSLLERMERACRCQFEPQNCNVGGVEGSGLSNLKSALAHSADIAPTMHVLRRCKNTIHQMINFTWKKSSELGKFDTFEVFDQKMFDFPRGVMSILSHAARGGRIITPEEYKQQQRTKIWKEELALMAPHHPEWRRTHA